MRRLWSFVVVSLVLAAVAPRTGAEPPAAGQGGLRVYVDPDTGAIVPPPPEADDARRAAPEADAAGEPAEPLTGVPSIVPGRGVMIDPRGRVRADVEATVGPDGTLGTRCVTRPAGAGAE